MIKLYELRTEKNISQREMAKLFNISQGTYNNWENEKTEPSIKQLIQLATFFNVSVDYLIGNSDDIGMINITKDLTFAEESLIAYYGNMSPSIKKALFELIKAIHNNN